MSLYKTPPSNQKKTCRKILSNKIIDCDKLSLLITITFSFLLIISCSRPSTPTVDGPEDDSLLHELTGYIITDRPVGGIIAISLPTLKETIIRPPNRNDGPVHNISGPDNKGRIVYVSSNLSIMAKEKHFLKRINIDGTGDKIIFEREGDAIGDDLIGKSFALSPSGGKVAFISRYKHTQMRNPDAYLSYGQLEIWDVESMTPHQTDLLALDDGLSWFPDGKQIAYTTLVPRNKISEEEIVYAVEGGFNEWPKLPVVKIFNLTDGASNLLHTGWNPVVSPNGESVIVSYFNGKSRLVNVKTSKSQPITWPGNYWRGAIAFVDESRILYWGLPTTGAKPKWGEVASPLVGPRQMLTLKIADLKSGKFKTVLPYVDRRRDISFGVVVPTGEWKGSRRKK